MGRSGLGSGGERGRGQGEEEGEARERKRGSLPDISNKGKVNRCVR